VKVSDFGMARLKNVTNNSHTTDSRIGPVKWMAPESLTQQLYSDKSDAFAFGICLWEMFVGQGDPPYGALDNLHVAMHVAREPSFRPVLSSSLQPSGLTMLLRQCWEHDPTKRPDFQAIIRRLDAMLQAGGGTPIVDEAVMVAHEAEHRAETFAANGDISTAAARLNTATELKSKSESVPAGASSSATAKSSAGGLKQAASSAADLGLVRVSDDRLLSSSWMRPSAPLTAVTLSKDALSVSIGSHGPSHS